MYCRCGLLPEAQEVFDTIPVQDVVLWNALITGYVDNGHGEEALFLLKDMGEKGISPDIVTLVCSLKICGSKGAMQSGREVHTDIAEKVWKENFSLAMAWLICTANVACWQKHK